jgi:hypothetical protein
MGILVSKIIEKGNRDLNSIGVRMENADWYDYITRAIRELKKGRTLPWQKMETDMDFYTDVFKYDLPSDFDSPIKPNQPLLTSDDEGPYLQYGREKDFYHNNQVKLALAWERGNKYLLARIAGTDDLLLDNFDDEATEYTIAGDGSGAVLDDINYREGSGSLRFSIADSTNQTTITRTKDEAVDVTKYVNCGKAFLHVYMPTVITSITLRYRSDKLNSIWEDADFDWDSDLGDEVWEEAQTGYFQISAVTTQANGDSFQVGWNLIAFNLVDAVETGVANYDNVDYFQIMIDNTGVSDVNFRVDGLYFRLPTNYRLPYNSTDIVETSQNSATYQEEINAENNYLLWEDTWAELIQWKTVELAAMFKFRDVELAQYCRQLYQEDLINFNGRYPSNEARPTSQYYKKSRSF